LYSYSSSNSSSSSVFTFSWYNEAGKVSNKKRRKRK